MFDCFGLRHSLSRVLDNIMATECFAADHKYYAKNETSHRNAQQQPGLPVQPTIVGGQARGLRRLVRVGVYHEDLRSLKRLQFLISNL